MFLKKIVKKIIWIGLQLLCLDYLIWFFSKVLYFLSKLLFIKEWQYNSGVPMFFKHQINYTNWRFDPSQWSFTLRGTYARELMQPGIKVLDLCCGDGAYSFLFFADVATHIDAVDYDDDAINYAKRFFKRDNINFQKVNVITEPLPATDYDIVVWNAGICYFTINDIHEIIKKVVGSSKNNMSICGMLPKANGHIDHKTEFETIEEVKMVFEPYFNEINIKAVVEGNNVNIVTFYFNATKPKIFNNNNVYI
jgi:SAM-dependent methyltransferase